MKPRVSFLKRFQKFINFYPEASRKKQKAQINKNINKKRVTPDTTEIQKIIRDFYKKIYTPIKWIGLPWLLRL